MTQPQLDLLSLFSVPLIVAACVIYGGAFLDRMNSLMSPPDPSEVEGEP